MIGSDHQNIVISHPFHKGSQLTVKCCRRLCIAFPIVPVSVHHVKIHQIHKTDSVKIYILCLDGFFHSVHIILDTLCMLDSLSCKNIIDFSYTIRIISGFYKCIQHRVFWRQ